MTTTITIADNTYWKQLAEDKHRENTTLINRIKGELTGWGINPLPVYTLSNTTSNPNHGPWQQAYRRSEAELSWWQGVRRDPWSTISTDQLIARIDEAERQAMKTQTHNWIREIVDFTNAEVGRTDEYDSRVPRTKGTNYHQRGHFFIFYEDNDREHRLALYPSDAAAGPGGFNGALVEGHDHQAFILNFDKPVSRFVDVYTCIGCGAVGQGFTALHRDYDTDQNNPSDSWNASAIYKKLPFEDYYTEFTTANFQRQPDGRIMSATGKYCLGNLNHLNDFHVWQGATIQDLDQGRPTNKTFEKAYGYIPRDSNGGTIQWKLARNPQNEAQWANKRIPYHMDALWKKNEFTAYANEKTIYQQRAMDMTIDEVLQERQYVIEYLKTNHNINIINSWLKEPLKTRFRRLITAKRSAYLALEELIKRHLNGADIETIRRETSVLIPNSTESPIQIPTSTAPEIIRTIWNRQVERFIGEGKAKEFYAERTGPNGSYPSIDYNSFEANINSLYQRLFDNLGFNQRVENIQQLEQVAKIVVNPRR